MRHERPVCTDPCFRNVSCSRPYRFSRNVIAADCNFDHVGHQPSQSIGHSCSLAVVRFGRSCYTHTCHRIDRFGDSDHLGLGLACNHGLFANQDIAPGQYRFQMSQFLKRQRMPVRVHPIFYSSNSLVLIPPLPQLLATVMPLGSGLKKPRFNYWLWSSRPQSTRYRAPINRHRKQEGNLGKLQNRGRFIVSGQ
jgi:hypothetical protein